MKKAKTQPIVCCGFTPCIQRILEFPLLEKGAANRAVRVTLGIGGKGANVARMVRRLGGESVLMGFAGGANGRLLERMLDDEGVDYRHIEVKGETRICQTLVEAGNPDTTELVEEMPALYPDEWESMLKLFCSQVLNESFVAISGKLPAGAPVDAYAQLALIVAEKGGRVIIDAPGEPLLRTLEYEPFLVKINDVELLQTVGGDDVMDASQQLLGMGAGSVLITRGSRTAFYVTLRETLEILPPRIDAVNPVGSGDAVTAGIAVAMSRGENLRDSLTAGMACGAANALSLVSGVFDPKDAERLKSRVRISKVN